eukprot:6210004-Pleurochrysis_carterae.AAC.1
MLAAARRCARDGRAIALECATVHACPCADQRAWLVWVVRTRTHSFEERALRFGEVGVALRSLTKGLLRAHRHPHL